MAQVGFLAGQGGVMRLMSVAAVMCFLGALSGCTGTGAQNFAICPETKRLHDPAKELRWAHAHALDIPRELEKHPLPPYTVEPGDVLLVQPADLDSPVRLPGDQPVLPDGTINLGKYGHLQVAGKTVADIEAMVRGAVQAQTKDAGIISVRLVTRQSKVFYVLGEVNAAGAFQLDGRETVLDAILRAGGLTDNASPKNIILSRPTLPHCPRVVLPVCYNDIVQLGDTTTNYQIAAGDRIFVPSISVREMLCSHCKKCKHCLSPCNGHHSAHPFPPHLGGPCCDGPHGPGGFVGPPMPEAAPREAASPPTDKAGPKLPDVLPARKNR